MKWYQVCAVGLLTCTIGIVGCDDGHDTSATTPVQTDRVDINVDAKDSPVKDRAERRQERRENIREAINEVDVNVGDGGVDVIVGDGEDGVDVDVE